MRAARRRAVGLATALAASLAGCARTPEWRPARTPLLTRWAAEVSPTNARPEYPRPMLVRGEWLNLNGLWDYALTPRDQRPERYDGRILVPYPVESALSGVGDTVGPGRTLWYRRVFRVPPRWIGRNVLLHFEAVDWETHVWVNGHHIGGHQGGYDPFTFDITAALGGRGGQEILVSVWDPTDSGAQARGKQVREPGGIFYTSVTGIWQTVWLEPVGAATIRDYAVTTDIDSGRVELTVTVDGAQPGDRVVAAVRAPSRPAPAVDRTAGAAGPEVARAAAPPGRPIVLRIPQPHLWSPDDPFLYDLELRLVRGGADAAAGQSGAGDVLDGVRGYFGIRKIAVGPDERGVTRLLLNNRFVFQSGPLDQGYWPDGLYTAPTESAMVYDLRVLKAMGYNMLRKHVKVEPRTFYTWCDRLGLLVWQDMPSASIPLVRPDADRATDTIATRQFEAELTRMIITHRNHPSIVMWVPFNEGWGQYDTERIVRLVRARDPTRLVDAASGWHERNVGDVVDRHNYPPPVPPRPDARRAAVQGEFGGLGLVVRGHTWKEGGWGYDLFGSREALTQRFEDFYQILRRADRERGLSAAVYTQTSDVETENNGLMTYDRAELKIAPTSVLLAGRGYVAPRVVRAAPIFVDSVVVSLTSPTPGAVIRYTIDGTPPRRFSPVYERPFALRQTATVMARAYWPDGAWSRVSSFGFAQVEPREAVDVRDARPELVVDYFEQDGSWRRLPAFDSLTPVRTGTTTVIGLAPARRSENYGLRFRGFIRVPTTGVYGFHLSSDDGSRLLVDGRPVVDNDGIHGMAERSGWVALEAGMHALEVVFFQGCCGVGLRLEVDVPGQGRRALPPGWMFHQGGGGVGGRGSGIAGSAPITYHPSPIATN
jgi:hypothetical protein